MKTRRHQLNSHQNGTLNATMNSNLNAATDTSDTGKRNRRRNLPLARR